MNQTTVTQAKRHGAGRWPLWFIRVATAGALAIDAYVHLDLASQYAESGGTINEGVLFRVESVVAVLAALAILVSGRLAAHLFALVVAGGALTVLLVSRYADLGPFGPLPNLYDPVWFPEKLLAAYAEGAAVATALAGVIITGRAWRARRTARPGTRPDPRASVRRIPAGNRQEEYQHDDRIDPRSTGPAS
jgi:hypothetical protein